jgi:hypothetical protein
LFDFGNEVAELSDYRAVVMLNLASDHVPTPYAVTLLVRGRFENGRQDANSSSNVLASFKSTVSNPSVNHQYTGANKFARLLHLALRAPEACEAHGSAEFPGFSLLLTSDRECMLEI